MSEFAKTYIQWKGTDVCMDFWCRCGAQHHIDAMFVYYVKCSDCGALYEMPTDIKPRLVPDQGQGLRYVTELEDVDEGFNEPASSPNEAP